MGLGGDSWNYKTSIRHCQQTNTQRFTGLMPFFLPNPNSVQRTEGKNLTIISFLFYEQVFVFLFS